jgi:acyl-CoA synthetase (AMP-forming)/AMP-acid ligase II
MRIFDYLDLWALERPQAEAVVFGDRRITYSDYRREAERFAAGLLALGIERGDRVGLYIPNHLEFLFGYLGTAMAGAVAVPVSWRFSAQEVAYVLGHSGARAVVMETGFMGNDFVQRLEEARPNLPQLERLVVIGGDGPSGSMPYEIFLREGEAFAGEIARRKEEVSEEDGALMLFTSGTTGKPKAPLLTHHNLVSYVRSMISFVGMDPEDRLLMDIPNNHVGGAVMAILSSLACGSTLVMLDSFIPSQVLRTIQEERITVMGQVPAQYILLFMQPDFTDYDLSTVRTAIISGAPTPPELVEQVREKMGIVPLVAYGMTETSGAITSTLPTHSWEKVKGSVGIPIPGVEVKIVGEEGKTVAPGTVGEIAVKGEMVMSGYFGQPEVTAQSFDKEGYFLTGDVGYIDEDGFLHIMARKKEMYIRGGENVYPPEVEDVLYRHPKVMFAAVVGYPDPVLGEKGRAYIVPKPGEELTENEIKEFCRRYLADFKVPDQVIFRDALPLTPLGKVHKYALQEEIRKEFEGNPGR